MPNSETQATWDYHDGTSHPDGKLLGPRSSALQTRQPVLLKVYRDLLSRMLPLDPTPGDVSTLQAIASVGRADASQSLDLQTVARLFFFSAGMIRHRTNQRTGAPISYRAAACTGALFHIECYLVSGDLPGLAAGVYHLDPQGPSIRQIRVGDYRQVLVEASGYEPHVAEAPALLVVTDVFWRNAIRYRAREYRHAFWDSGTILAQMLACAQAHHLPARVIAGFVDAMVSGLLDLDPREELPLALLPLGAVPDSSPSASPSVDRLHLAVQPGPGRVGGMSAILAMHAASSLADPAEVAAWRGALPRESSPAAGSLVALTPLTEDALPAEPLEQVILRRGSTRKFTHEALTFEQLSTVLYYSLQDIAADFLAPPGAALAEIYLIVHAVEGLEAGAYVLRREDWTLELLQAGSLRDTSGYLGMKQTLAYDASVNVFFLADLPPLLERFGNRGYRAAQLEAGIAGGRMYLAAYAQGLGATGLTFYDDAVTTFFSPRAHGKRVLFLVALGQQAGRSSAALP